MLQAELFRWRGRGGRWVLPAVQLGRGMSLGRKHLLGEVIAQTKTMVWVVALAERFNVRQKRYRMGEEWALRPVKRFSQRVTEFAAR